MKYRGRFILLFISLVSACVYLVIGNVQIIPFTIFTLIEFSFSWFIGGWYDKYRYLSYHDPLTGVYNRRYAYMHLERYFKIANRRHERIGILNIDIDNFKLINDTYGHSYGDFILKGLCRIIVENTRKEDILVRWGGDEFLLFVIDKDDTSLENLTYQINDTIKTDLNNYGESKKHEVTVSIGHSIYPDDGQNISDLLSISDKRMYKVKSITKEVSLL
ncbi:GGDEF domain-containing protein [Sporosarcina pasteurii]|uniref:Probable diguanylate cyclase YcdT n=1 Tax=Sporosarcina pasteurii TaxID=1474 RepID=A0A380CLJ5_SPOPA|nr:GGDEF domain-containing protein [Sporosarcina pasteurii]MDS9471864.1 GGDEF domain-containing protein [Sporosarcina pasteurii]QBQ06603.1 GGDEF domain-containing protein [Sporosarcina pasteurii]SUJ22000.1 Probable diguanylate cyclase YcdT [Sporosarcina pasteurii]